MKRAIDLLIVVPSLILLSPLLLAIAIAIRATSSGPALFRQERVGWRGELFEILKFRTMVDEIFGPVLTVHVYEDSKFEETLDLCDTSSMYALTGAIFANDRRAASFAIGKLNAPIRL